NVCAHHSRLWNKRLSALPHLPYETLKPFLNKTEIKQVYPNKVYAPICCIYYILKIIDSSNTFKKDLIELMECCPLNQNKEMGFPDNWLKQSVWKTTIN